ncbi:MAG: carbohydrate-binding domain-containing protein [Lachnospiraceae bacterium]|nr:carbohydrate-binding domain-containing protein [Lachnospiraceae bacterium]
MKKKVIMAIIGTAFLMAACGKTDTGDVVLSESEEYVLTSLEGENSDIGSEIFEEIDSDDIFTDRDNEQSVDLTDASYISVKDGSDVTITEEGVYVLSGSAEDATVYVEADSSAKVQLVLDGLVINNSDRPCIYIKSADKVFVTTVSDDNVLTVSGSFTTDGETNTDAVIFSKDDLVLNGTGSLTVTSSDNGIAGKDGVRITGGSLMISCEGSAIEAHNAIEIADGVIDISNCNDGLHAEDSDDDTVGYIYISGGSISINASDDALHATTIVKIDDGTFELSAAEAIEGTAIQINGGEINISAADDGINAASKSSAYDPLFELNDGNVTIAMGAGDTDGVDSNGDIIINGGTISITGQSAFDYTGSAEYNGGTVIVNGEETDTITNQFMGGPGMEGGQGNRFQNDGTRPEGTRTEGTKPSADGETPGGREPAANDEMPEGMELPANGEMPDGMGPSADGEVPEGFEPPANGNRPEGFEPPANGERPEGQ